MPYGLYISAEGAYAQSMRLDVIANNMANVDTVGFKRQLAVFQARNAEAIEQGSQIPGLGAIEDIGGGILVRETKTDTSPGPLKSTNRREDVAIRDPDAFFVVRKGDETLLTRAGNFVVTEDGKLTTAQGYEVLDSGAAPIIIGDPNWKISTSGTVQQVGARQDLAMVRPESWGDLVHVGENLFRPLAETQPVPLGQRSVASGYLEASSVKPTSEMTEMIQAARTLEANVNLMKAQDEMLAGLINRAMSTGR